MSASRHDGPEQLRLPLGDETGGPEVIAEMAEHARLLALRYGDRVAEWGTVNEPINCLLAAYGLGTFPPGKAAVPGEQRATEALRERHVGGIVRRPVAA